MDERQLVKASGSPPVRIVVFLRAALAAAVFATAHAQAPSPDVLRLHVHSPTLTSAGQPTRSQIPALAAAGYKVVINLAPQNAPGSIRDEQQLVEASGMQYHFIPVDWEKPSVDNALHVLNLLDKHRDVPVFLHCSLNARASAFAYLHRTLRANEPDAAEYKVMSRLWALNRGIEIENTPQWLFLIEDVKARHGRK